MSALSIADGLNARSISQTKLQCVMIVLRHLSAMGQVRQVLDRTRTAALQGCLRAPSVVP
jgi:hypothetical protein